MTIDELGDRALLDQPALSDHHEVVGHLGHLREQVAADQHRTALAGEVDQHVTDPANAFGIQPVGRLVEHHGLRITEQHSGQPETLLHPQRVRLDPPAANRFEPDQPEDLVDA